SASSITRPAARTARATGAHALLDRKSCGLLAALPPRGDSRGWFAASQAQGHEDFGSRGTKNPGPAPPTGARLVGLPTRPMYGRKPSFQRVTASSCEAKPANRGIHVPVSFRQNLSFSIILCHDP